MLRSALRTGLSDAHLRVDRLFSCFDLTVPAGLAAFCRANENALRRLRFPVPYDAAAASVPAGASGDTPRGVEGHAPDSPATDPLRIDATAMITALQADRRALGDDAPLPPLAALAVTPHPVAVAYILLGSRLGTQVLRRDWAQSADTQVQGAGRYFALPPLTAEWRRLVADLDARPVLGPDAQQILSDAEAIFDLFARSALLELTRMGVTAPN